MGDRTTVFFKSRRQPHAVVVYLHWCGGPHMVINALDAVRDAGFRKAEFCAPRFIQLMGEMIGDSLWGLGIHTITAAEPDEIRHFGNEDNGAYWVDDNMECTMRYVSRFSVSGAYDDRGGVALTDEERAEELAEARAETKHRESVYACARKLWPSRMAESEAE